MSISESRPLRRRQLPSKFHDYTGLPTHLVNVVPSTEGFSGSSNIFDIMELDTFKQALQNPE